ncbi:MAG TPA: ABC-F family ATP-binding cassette domain-containing protein [Candidatus Obscuribacter sp.]|nr:ABC-F family ATP-binding cassette domain-containing protein [Candidatus Obscuribacter sp.]HNG73150.1 ABC-F family ATP-binding cassette domain-containing protein [Candidatus Obscuribacter sp.]
MAAPLITCQSLTKSYTGRTLFSGINFAVEDDEKVALIGPNGSGKSTLLKILAGLTDPDEGAVVSRRDLKVAYLPQYHNFDKEKTVLQVVLGDGKADAAAEAFAKATLTRLGFSQMDSLVKNLSGGWVKRLALAVELNKQPDFLLLDEPTNHLDLAGVLFLEEFLRQATFSFMLVSHDRSFIENIATRVIELSPTYKDGYLSVRGSYSDFVVGKQEYLAYQNNEEKALASKMRREVAWLMRGARARQTKSQHRIKEAGKLMEELSEVKLRNSQKVACALDFTSSNRRTKELVLGKGLSKNYGERLLFKNLDLILTPGLKLGLAGLNGSGKTTLLKIIAGKLEPDQGTIKRADGLKVVWFDQMRDALDQSLTLKEALCPHGDHVEFRGRSMHIASWAKRFLFRPEQLPLTLNYLSGGEQARIFIANLMRQPADLLILDEPTNDLDIATLEVLEESLDDFPGAVVLVTHDRFMLDSISTHILALDGMGGAEYFADYLQWQDNLGKRIRTDKALVREEAPKNKPQDAALANDRSGKPLSNNEKKELAGLEDKIAAAEEACDKLRARMDAPDIAANHVRLAELMQEVEAAKCAIDKLYERFAELDERSKLSRV